MSPVCPTGGWKTAVLALHTVLSSCSAENQGTAERLWLLEFLIPEREGPSLAAAAASPPSASKTQQLSPQVR